MREKWAVNAVLVVAVACLGWGQMPGLLHGPFPVETDSGGFFTAEVETEEDEPQIIHVSGKLLDSSGNPIAGKSVNVYAERRIGPGGVRGFEIAGVGRIAAVWIEVEGYEPERIATFEITQTGLLLTPLVLRAEERCTPGAYQIQLLYDDCTVVVFIFRRCEARGEGFGVWSTWRAKSAMKGDSLPSAHKDWHWVVRTERGKRVTYAFHESDGTSWQEMVVIEIPVVTVRPATCQHCSHVLVETDDSFVLYHCERGRWVLVSMIKRPRTQEDKATDGKTEETEWEIPIYWEWEGFW